MTGAWGDGDSASGGGASVPAELDLGDGHSMSLNPEVFRRLLHRPEVVAAITARAHGVADAANSLAVHIGRPGRPAPKYGVRVQDDPESARARAQVYPANYQAVLDDQRSATMLKALHMSPGELSEPRADDGWGG